MRAPKFTGVTRDLCFFTSLHFASTSKVDLRCLFVCLFVCFSVSLFLSIWGLPVGWLDVPRTVVPFAQIVNLGLQRFQRQCSQLLSKSSAVLLLYRRNHVFRLGPLVRWHRKEGNGARLLLLSSIFGLIFGKFKAPEQLWVPLAYSKLTPGPSIKSLPFPSLDSVE
jgi:hypothetical protein